MPYISKQEVQAKQAKLKLINKKYGVTARFSGSNSNTLTLTVTSGKIDFVSNAVACLNKHNKHNSHYEYSKKSIESGHIACNHYCLSVNFSGIALEYLQEVYNLMQEGYYDRSDAQIDYFDYSWYNSIQIGKWNKPYIYIEIN